MPLPIYGAREGLASRLDEWAHRLSTDKSLPWMGSGLIADLRAAAAAVEGRAPEPEPEEWEKQTEYDL